MFRARRSRSAPCPSGSRQPPLRVRYESPLGRHLRRVGGLRQGIELWEYQPQVLHAKSIVVDDIVFVGSSNLDPRSLRINFEVMLRIRNPALAATAREQFEADVIADNLERASGNDRACAFLLSWPDPCTKDLTIFRRWRTGS